MSAAIWAWLRPGDEIAVDLRTLKTRLDEVFDRARQINCLCAQMLEIFPAWNGLWNCRTPAHVWLLSRVAEGNLTPRLSQNGA
ncbi:hypothetical protein ACIRVM_47070 [Streptomyces chartreusis]|uniref:hypothetical protein n=1 Tax=Streptomyces chartreusis TaxID=1969 RepID=UPI003810A45E